jgi:addiction module RelB/DinJ family antitoxin
MAASRSATLQARIRPEIKSAGEYILHRIGLSMTEAMELFLRRVIIDQKLPFEVVALDDVLLETTVRESKLASRSGSHSRHRRKYEKRE